MKGVILFIDEAPHTNQAFLQALTGQGYQVILPEGEFDWNRPFDYQNVDVVVYGMHGEASNGLYLKRAYANQPHVPLVAIIPLDHPMEAQLNFAVQVEKVRPLSSTAAFLEIVEKQVFLSQQIKSQNYLNDLLALPTEAEFDVAVGSTMSFLASQLRADDVLWIREDFLQQISKIRGNTDYLRKLLQNGRLPMFHRLTDLGEGHLVTLFESSEWDQFLHSPSSYPVFHAFTKGTTVHVLPFFKDDGCALRGVLLVANPKNRNRTLWFKECGFFPQFSSRFKSLLKFQDAKAQSYTDDLTELYNQRYLPVILDQEIGRASRQGGVFSVLFMDLDYFKSVNDTRGHLVGSKILAEIGRIIRSSIRNTDMGFRYGGDEYLVILAGANSQQAFTVAERIRKKVESTVFDTGASQVRLTVSIGIASFPEHAQTKEKIIEMADEAMYYGKNRSRNVVYIAS